MAKPTLGAMPSVSPSSRGLPSPHPFLPWAQRRPHRRCFSHGQAAAITAVIASALTLSGCAESSPERSTDDRGDERPLVLTTFTILEDITAQVGGDRVDVETIAPAGAEIHEYDPTPSDLRTAVQADLILSNGLGLEAWYDRFLDQVEAENVTLTQHIDPLPVTSLPGHPEAGEDLPENPHAWMSPTVAQDYVTAAQEALSELSPEDADYFAKNAAEYRAELQEIADDARERVEQLDSRAHLVTCEGAFSYLTEDLGLQEHYLWPVNAGTEGTPQQVEAQTQYVIDHEVPMIFCESTVNDAAQQQVAETADAELGEPLYVDSLTGPDGDAPTFLELLRYDIERILDGAEAGSPGTQETS